jgi:Cytochrome c3
LARIGRVLRRHAVLATVVLLSTILAGILARRFHRWVTRDPRFCLSCHGAVAEQMQGHAHAGLPCANCHRSDLVSGVRIFVQRGASTAAPHGQVDQSRCRTCHFQVQKSSIVAKSGGHLLHVLSDKPLECSACHIPKDHQSTVDRGACHRCHDKIVVLEHGMGEVACLACHSFLEPSPDGHSMAEKGCVNCHTRTGAAPGARLSTELITSENTHGNVNACRLCHHPHATSPAERRKGANCAACHQRIVEQNRAAPIAGHPGCETCHQVHGPRPKTPALCVRCHADKPGPAGSKNLSTRHQGCSGCHKPHSFDVPGSRCAGCHRPEQAKIASWPSDRHANCRSCHSGHAEKEPATACPDCHAPQKGHGHKACTTCHDPHLNKSGVSPCAKCHGQEVAAVALAAAPTHRVCASCHLPHAAPLAPAACARCHAREAALARTVPMAEHQACVSCHDGHPFDAARAGCVHCHDPASRAPHKQGCVSCHAPHGPPIRGPAPCQKCHTKVATPSGKHAACTSCHAPHQAAKPGPQCTACHTENAAGAATWAPPPHKDCASCHARHDPAKPKACAQCHAEVASTPLAKGHFCVGCHNPHRPLRTKNAACAGCHASNAAAVSGQTKTHAQCLACHKPHQAGRPSCLDCHKNRPAGGHTLPGHETCRNCHGTHNVQVPGRAKCLSCHKDKVNHFANAPQCISCHAFR